MAILAAVTQLVALPALIRDGASRASNGQAPFLLDMAYPIEAAHFIFTLRGDGLTFAAAVREDLRQQISSGNAALLIVAPLALAVVAWFAVETTREWLTARRRG